MIFSPSLPFYIPVSTGEYRNILYTLTPRCANDNRVFSSLRSFLFFPLPARVCVSEPFLIVCDIPADMHQDGVEVIVM